MTRLNGFDPDAIERDMRRQLDRETARQTGANSRPVRAAAMVLRKHMRRVVGVRGTEKHPSPVGSPPHRILGDLYRSIRTATVAGVRRVGSGYYKARLTEFGSIRTGPRPFARAGLEAAADEMMDVVVSELRSDQP